MELRLVGVLLLPLSLVFFVLGVVFWRRYRKQQGYATTNGVVVKLDPDSSGEYATVHYSPQGQLLVGGQPYVLKRSVSSGQYQVGDPIPVRYDPSDPARGTLLRPGHSLALSLTFAICGSTLLPLSAMMTLWLGPLGKARDETLSAFIEAARTNDSARLKALSAPTAQVSESFVHAAASSHSHRLGSNNIGFSNDACIEVYFDANPRTYYVYMDKPSDWRIVRANSNDPECVDDLRE